MPSYEPCLPHLPNANISCRRSDTFESYLRLLGAPDGSIRAQASGCVGRAEGGRREIAHPSRPLNIVLRATDVAGLHH